MNKSELKLKGNNYQGLITKFKEREEQTSIQQALVYLKLRQFNCDHRRSMIFSKKKEKGIDGTLHKDGPAGFKKLVVIKPDARLTNGWLRGQKHKYMGATGYTDFLKKQQSVEKKSITSYHKKSREQQQLQRKARSKSTIAINIRDPQRSIEKIGTIKEEASKQRQNRNVYIEYSNVRLDQTTKSFFKQAQNIAEDGLVFKLGAFDHIINDKELDFKEDLSNLKGKTLTTSEINGANKRSNLLSYQEKIKEYSDGICKNPNGDENSWKRVIHTKNNKQKHLLFGRKTLDEASNPLILSSTKQLKRDLNQNEKKCMEKLNKYTNFYKDVEKAIKIEFLGKRKLSHPVLSLQERKQSLVAFEY